MMKMRTKLASYLVAGVMAFSTILPMLGTIASAASIGSSGSSGSPIFGDGTDELFGVTNTEYPAIGVYLCGDERLQDGDINGDGQADAKDFSLAYDIINGIDSDGIAGTDYDWITRYRNSSNMVMFFPSRSLGECDNTYMTECINGHDDVFIATSASSYNRVTGFYLDKTSTHYVDKTGLATSTWAKWNSILGSVSSINPISSDAQFEYGDQIYRQYKKYRESVNFDANAEYTDLIEPIISVLGDSNSMVREIKRRHDAQKPVTLIIEIYFPNVHHNMYFSMHAFEKSLQHKDSESTASLKTFGYNHSGIYDVDKGDVCYGYYNALEGAENGDGLRRAFRPAYNSQYDLNESTNQDLLYNGKWGIDIKQTGSPTPSGLAYFSLCTTPSPSNLSLVVKKNISIEGTSDYIDTNDLAKYFTAHISAPFQAQDLNTALANMGSTTTVGNNDPINDLASALAELLGDDTTTYNTKITQLGGRFMSKGYESGVGRPKDNLAVFTVDPDDSSGTPMATFKFSAPLEFVTTKKGIDNCYYVVYETGSGNDISGVETTWTANAVAIVRLAIEDGAYSWKCYNVKTNKDNATVTTKSSAKEKMTIIMNNAVTLKPEEKETKVNIESARTTILDVDKYYLTNYDPAFGYNNNEQLVYTDTRSALPKSNLGFIHAWYRNTTDAPDALNFNVDTIVDNLDTKDNVVDEASTSSSGTIGGLLTPIVDKLSTFTKVNGYTWNFALSKGINSSFKVERDYVRKYDLPKVFSFVGLDTAIAAANAGGNTGNFSDPVTSVKLTDGTEYTDTLPVVGQTYKVDSTLTAVANNLSAGDVKAKLNTYVDYARNYALYEAMVATSAYNIKEAMKFYSKAALALYKEANDLATKEIYEADTWNEPVDGCRLDKNATTASEASSRVTTYNTQSKAKAQEAETKIKQYSTYLAKLTGWEFQYCIAYRKKSYSSSSIYHCCCYCGRRCYSWHCHCYSVTGTQHNITDSVEYLRYGMTGSSTGARINLAKASTLTVTKLPGALQSLVNIVKSGATTTSGAYNLGGMYADLVKDAQKMQTELAKLENNRPYAEIHIISRYEADAKSEDLYQGTTVPEYMVAMWWKNQTPFVKGNTRLSTVLDWTPYSAASSSLVSNASPKMLEGNVSTSGTLVMDRLNDSSVSAVEGSSYDIVATNGGKSSTAYRPVYTFMWRNRPFIGNMDEFLDAVKAAGSKIKTVAQDKTGEARYVYTPGDYFVTNDLRVFATNLDGIGYLTNDVAIWTSIWAMDTANPTNTVIPGEWNIPSGVATAVRNTKTGAKVNQYDPVVANVSQTGADSVKNIGYFIGHASTSDDGKAPLLQDVINNLSGKVYYSDTNFTQDAESYFFFGSNVTNRLGVTKAYYAPDQANEKNALGLQSKLEVYASTTPYKVETTFKHFNVGEAEGTPELDAASTYDEEDEHFWDDHNKAYGYYTRTSTGSFYVYPLVKRAYYDNAHKLAYTYVVGQKAREIKSNVFYQIGLVGSATPTVVTNAPASGSMATGLANRYGAGNVSYSGAGITITYTPDVSMYFQTYALEDEDIEKEYQKDWGNGTWIAANNEKSAHDEWLESMGAAQRNIDTGTGDTEIGVWTIPYIAGAETALKASKTDDWTTGKWVLDQDGAKLALADNSDPLTRTVNIKLYVEGGELVGIYVPADYVNSDGETIVNGYYTQDGRKADDTELTAVDANGEFKGWSTSDLITTLRAQGDTWHTRDIAKALEKMGITGGANCLLKKSFVNGVGANVTADFNGNTATGLMLNDNQKSYNEYTYSLCLRVETTKFRLQTLMFTDKLPTEYGPATPADKSQYFSDGYGFQASALLLKIGEETDSSETTGVSNPLEDMASIIGTTWRINRNDSTNPDAQSDAVDLVIGNVDVTAAN